MTNAVLHITLRNRCMLLVALCFGGLVSSCAIRTAEVELNVHPLIYLPEYSGHLLLLSSTSLTLTIRR
jgi:hypothetical protein